MRAHHDFLGERVATISGSRSPWRPGSVRTWTIILVASIALIGLVLYQRFEASRETDQRREAIRAALAARDSERAETLIEDWEQRGSVEPTGTYYRALLALDRGQYQEAAEATQRAIDRGIDDRERLKVLQAVLMTPSQPSDEFDRVLLQAFRERSEPRRDVLRVFTQRCLESYQITSARLVLEAWLEEYPDDLQALKWHLEMLMRTDPDLNDLITAYERVLVHDPADRESQFNLAKLLAHTKGAEEARPLFEDYLERYGDDPEAMTSAGLNDILLGDFETGQHRLEEAIRIDPDHARAWEELGNLAWQRGEIDQACDFFARAIEADPYLARLRYRYQLTLKLAGRREEAYEQEKEYQRLLDETESMDELRRELLKRPNDLDLQIEVARWHFRRDQAEEGVRWAKKILDADPGRRDALELLETYYRDIGEVGKANYYLDQLQSVPSST